MSSGSEVGAVVDVAGVATNVHDVPAVHGGGGVPVLLLHGSGPGVSAWANWRGVIPVLARSRRVIAPDLVGFGYTAAPEGFVFSREAWVAHVVALLDTLGVEKVVVVGNSFGGALALWLAHAHPDRVDRLVLMGSVGVPFPITEGLDTVWGYTPSVECMDRVMGFFAYDRSRVTPELVQLRYQASVRPGVSEAFTAMFPAPRQAGVDALALSYADIQAIGHPVLVVHGRDDRVIPLEASLRLHELLPDSELHVFGRCGHWVQIEAADRFVDVVQGFLD